MLKRKLSSSKQIMESVSLYTRSKRPKLYKNDLPTNRRLFNTWISATHTRNYMINDQLVDWLKHNNKRKNAVNKNDFMEFIMERGIEFENEVVKYIRKKHDVTFVSTYITDESVKKTISLMKEGVNIIHSAPVKNFKNNTKGVIDLLVRSDYLNNLIEECPLLPEETTIKASNLNGKYHYVVIDIKFSTLPLKSDGRHILNSGSYPAYKAQLFIYTEAINEIQGYMSNYAYILGRRWRYTQKNINYSNFSCMNKIGVIDYKTVDKEYIDKTKKAINWVRDVKQNGHKWSVSPPSRNELYPNMCKDSGKWQKEKAKIAEDLGEITNIWYCGVKNRDIGLKNNIKNWKDPNCNSSNIGIKGVRATIIDQILNINRQDDIKILPEKIIKNLFDWRLVSNEIFVDFETITDIFSSFSELPKQKSSDMIFMIGVYYKNNKKEWSYKNFICKKPTYEEEYRIMDEFNSFITSQKNPKIWYWCAENKFWKRSENRQYDLSLHNKKQTKNIVDNWKVHNWTDMCELFKQEPIIIKDCFKFGLKSVSSAMKKHGFIETQIDSECNSGMSAMVLANNCYKTNPKPEKSDIMKDISVYNKFDCKVLYEMLNYLRNNH